MNQRIEPKDQELINGISDREYDEDDALILLDDEEAQASTNSVEDEDLSSFYLDYPEETEELSNVDLYTEKPITENSISTIVEEISNKNDNGQDGYQGQLDKLNNNIDAYLNGGLEVKSSNDEVKVEKIESTPVSVVKPIVETPTYVKPVVEEVVPAKPTLSSSNEEVDLNNLNKLFAKVEDNVKGASDIVNKNAEIKRKIDERYNELQKLQIEHERNKQRDYAEINAYKDDAYTKLKTKKLEIEQQMTQLKKEQESFIKEKELFEKEKKEASINIAKKEQELNDSYYERTRNIEQVENGLIKRKEQLDLEKATLLKEKEMIEKDKKELAENLIKFNQLVDNFTKGVDRFNETN